MFVKIKKELAQDIGFAKLKPFGISEDKYSWNDSVVWLNLVTLDDTDLTTLQKLCRLKKGNGAQAVIRDINAYVEARDAGDDHLPKSVQQFATMLMGYLRDKVPGHRLYKRMDDTSLCLCYYVESVHYYPPEVMGKDKRVLPAHCTMSMSYERMGAVNSTSTTFYAGDVLGRTIPQAIMEQEWLPETDDLRKDYDTQTAHWRSVVGGVGIQYLARGYGSTERVDRWSGGENVRMMRLGQPVKVVVDTFKDDADSDEDDGNEVAAHPVSNTFWARPQVFQTKGKVVGKGGAVYDEENDDEGEPEEVSESEELNRSVDIPVHPYAIVFDLSKHRRVEIHTAYLALYQYNTSMSDSLVMSEDRKLLVKVMVDGKAGNFEDLVVGKGGGTNVLLIGPPGTGKTLTAEIFAENECKPLYSVQCSQLGLNATDIEKELQACFNRACRWNAVMLLDEADVYIRARGNDIHHNAIVGVFLRMLEYQTTVLFMTTNQDTVDDAIASRCVARIQYSLPSMEQQMDIWRLLTRQNKLIMAEADIKAVAAENPGFSGRDVKNVLKLVKVMAGKDRTITRDMVRKMRIFRPAVTRVPVKAVPAKK